MAIVVIVSKSQYAIPVESCGPCKLRTADLHAAGVGKETHSTLEERGLVSAHTKMWHKIQTSHKHNKNKHCS